MTKRDKRLERLRQSPKNVSLDTLKQVLEAYGFWLDRIVGSHHVFRAQVGTKTWRLTIPYNKPIKIIYVKQTLEAIEQVLEARDADDEPNN
jgi:predicted RNA binding protein YcfA (HicA-like mRNA interferase family)